MYRVTIEGCPLCKAAGAMHGRAHQLNDVTDSVVRLVLCGSRVHLSDGSPVYPKP